MSASRVASGFFITYSIAALRLNASMSAVSFSTGVFPTDFTSTPSVTAPTDNSGWSRTPRSTISARCFSAGPNCFMR